MNLVVDVPSIGWSNFARENSTQEKGNSYTCLSEADVITLISENWSKQEIGMGESDYSRKIVVPVPSVLQSPRFGFLANTQIFFGVTFLLQEGMPIQSKIVRRSGQDSEEPFIQNYITFEDSKNYSLEPVNVTSIVLYSKEALLENDGVRSTNCDWEVVAIITASEPNQPMLPLTMARNQLELDGGTASVYTDKEYAKAIAYWSKRVRVLPEKPITDKDEICKELAKASDHLLSLHARKIKLAQHLVDVCHEQGMSDNEIVVECKPLLSESNLNLVAQLIWPKEKLLSQVKIIDALEEKEC